MNCCGIFSCSPGRSEGQRKIQGHLPTKISIQLVKCVDSSRCHEVDITVMYHEWIFRQRIYRWQKKYKNVKNGVVEPTVTEECIYGLKEMEFIAIQRQF